MLGDDGLAPAGIEFGHDRVAVEGPIGDQGVKRDPIDQRRHADRVIALPRQQHEADEIAERVGQRQDFRRRAALGAADGLAVSPPFAP
jgi:hypothetical protein